MAVRPRILKSLGFWGVTLLSASSAMAQSASPQTAPGPGNSAPKKAWKSTTQSPGQGQVGSAQSEGAAGQAAPSQPTMPGATTPEGATGNQIPPANGGATTPPSTAGTSMPPPGAAATPPGAAADAGTGPSLSSGLGGSLSGPSTYFGMVGDPPPISRLFTFRVPTPPPIPAPGKPPTPPGVHPGLGRAVAVLPSIRGFKVSENQSPAPQDRIYFSSNFYDNLNGKVNQRFDSGVSNLQAYRYILGLEKTLLDGRASIGLRLPIDSLSVKSSIPGLGGTTHAAGDLAAIMKYALIQDRDAGRLLSVGLLVSMPTGPSSFAGAHGIRSPHNPALQPFVGFIQSYGDLYFQGFSSVDVPLNPNDVTMMYNDLGMGYYVYRSDDYSRLITAIAPTFETHVNTPLNHRNPYNLNDLAGTYDNVNLTFGTNFQIHRRGLLALAIVEPVTGPRPFHLETLVQFNLRF
jgi:hypothetical protein